MRWICSSAVTIVMLVSQSAVPPTPIQPPRDSRQDRAADVGAIAGRIADRDSHEPIRWATVTVVQSSRQLQMSTTADADGRYRFDNLPSGTYTVRARKAGYVPLAYGARKPRDPGTPIDVAAGTTVTADVLLSRGGAIEGRILNEYGDPAQDVGMQALRVGYDSTGRRTFPTGQSTRTDDLGWFRLHSLPPGMYLVEASRAFVSPVSPSDQQELAQRPKPFPRTFYPGTARVNEAGYVVVEKGRTRSVDFSLSVEPLSLLSGTVVNSRGEVPEMTGASLRYAGGAPFGGFSLAINRNQFALTGIQPGAYVLVVTARTSGSEVEFAMLPVTMTGRDVVEPGIQTAPGVVLDGMVEMDARDGAGTTDECVGGCDQHYVPGVACGSESATDARSRVTERAVHVSQRLWTAALSRCGQRALGAPSGHVRRTRRHRRAARCSASERRSCTSHRRDQSHGQRVGLGWRGRRRWRDSGRSFLRGRAAMGVRLSLHSCRGGSCGRRLHRPGSSAGTLCHRTRSRSRAGVGW